MPSLARCSHISSLLKVIIYGTCWLMTHTPSHGWDQPLLCLLLSQRCHGHALHLRPSPQPEGVAKPRGTRVPEGGQGMSPGTHTSSFGSHLYGLCPLPGWRQSLDSTHPGPGAPHRCSTLPASHQVLLAIATLSCPSQEEHGECPVCADGVGERQGASGLIPSICDPPVFPRGIFRPALCVGVAGREALCGCLCEPRKGV